MGMALRIASFTRGQLVALGQRSWRAKAILIAAGFDELLLFPEVPESLGEPDSSRVKVPASHG